MIGEPEQQMKNLFYSKETNYDTFVVQSIYTTEEIKTCKII